MLLEHVTSEIFWTHLETGHLINYVIWKWVEQEKMYWGHLEPLMAIFGLGPFLSGTLSLFGTWPMFTLQTIWRHDNRSNQDFYWVPDYAALRIFEIDSLWKMTCTASPSWVVATQANTGAITLYSEVVHTFDTNIKPLNVVPSAPYMTCRHLLSFSRLGLISGSWTHCHTMKWFHSRMWWTTYNLLQKPL